jgi:hypothetical protein
MSGYAIDALAGLARCALAEGHLKQAQTHIARVWDYLQRSGVRGMEFPIWSYQTCAEVYRELGEPAKSRAALEMGYAELMARAKQISDADWRQSFLKNVPEHRAVQEMWESEQDN